MATKAELTAKYTEAFKNFTENEADWKRTNVDSISEGYSVECKGIINHHFSEAAETANTLGNAVTPMTYLAKKAGADPVGSVAVQSYLEPLRQTYGDGLFGGLSEGINYTNLREVQNALMQAKCGKTADEIEAVLDNKWEQYKNEQILASGGVQEDIAVARKAGQDATKCAEELVELKEKLGTAIEKFYSGAHVLFREGVVIPRGGFAGNTGDEGYNYLKSIKAAGSFPDYISMETVSFGSQVESVWPIISADDSIATKLKFDERLPAPMESDDSASKYPVLYFSMLLNIVKGAEYVYASDFWPTQTEAAALYQGVNDSSLEVLRKVGGSGALRTKFRSENSSVSDIEIETNIGQNDVNVSRAAGEFTEEQQKLMSEALEAGSLVQVLESYTPNMLGDSSQAQIGNTPQSAAAEAEALSRKKSVTAMLDHYVQGAIPTFSRTDYPPEVKDFITLIASVLKGVLDAAKSNAICVRDNAELFAKEKEKVTDALLAAARNTGAGKTIAQQIGWGGKAADPNAAASLAQAAQNLNNLQIEDTAFASLEAKKLFKEQCFLLAFVAKFADYKKNTLDSDLSNNPIQKRMPYTSLQNVTQSDYAKNNGFNASLQIDGMPYGFINRLTQTPSYKSLIDIQHSTLSHLQPRIRLFKVVYDGLGSETEVEIEFNSAFFKTELERTFKNKKARGAGVGLKNFEFTYDGSNPFAAKKSIKAKMSLHAASFSELFDMRTGNATTVDGDGNLTVTGDHKYRYVDLALKTSNNPKQVVDDKNWARILEENGHLSKLNFRLKAVVGWSLPAGRIAGLTTTQRIELNNALGDSFVTLNLTPTIHNFDFNETGAVQFDINYLAYVEDFFDQRAFNVFANPDGDTSWEREIRRLKFMNARKKCATADSISEINDSYKEIVQTEMRTHLSSLIKSLMNTDKVYFINFPYEKVQDFVAAGPYKNYQDYVTLATDEFIKSNSDNNAALTQLIETAVDTPQTSANSTPGTTEERNTIAQLLISPSPEDNMVSFFYLSDLVDIVLENIQKELKSLADSYASPQNLSTYTDKNNDDPINEDDFKKRRTDLIKFEKNFKRFRLLLGPVELHHVKKTDGKNSEFVNFGDIPISVKYFIEWVAGQVLSKDEIFYPLSTFLNQLLNNLVTNFLNSNRCFYFDIKQKIRVNQAVVSSYSPPNSENTDTLTALIKEKDSTNHPARLHLEDPIAKENRPILNVSGRTGHPGITYAPLSHETNYLVYYAGKVASPSKTVDRAKDEEAGIFHYMLGRDRGLIKNIKLQKTQTKGLAEARFEMDGYDGLQQLRVVYDVDIETFANVNTFPGTYIYIPPGGFDPSWSKYGFSAINMTSLGIGGYYMIIKSTHRFAPGEANTKIYAKWVNSLESDYPAADASSSDPSSTTADASCEGAASRLARAKKP